MDSGLVDLSPRLRPHRGGGVSQLVLQPWGSPGVREANNSNRSAGSAGDDALGRRASSQCYPGCYALREGTSLPGIESEGIESATRMPRRARSSRAGAPALSAAGWSEGLQTAGSTKRKAPSGGGSRASGQAATLHSKQLGGLASGGVKRPAPRGAGGTDDPLAPAQKRKRGSGRRVCLACDLGRKRRCTCGKRTRH